MAQVVFAGKNVRIEYEARKDLIIATWKSFAGRETRLAIDAAASHVENNGAYTWIQDCSQVHDVPSQEDQKWVADVAANRLVPAGLRQLINVLPAGAMLRMGVKRWSEMVKAQPRTREPIDVPSLAEALALVE